MKKLLLCNNYHISKYHTYGIDAKAKYFAEVEEFSVLQEVLAFAKEEGIPFVVLGRGSNVLFKDDFYNGLVIANKMVGYKLEGQEILCESGVNLPLLARKMAKKDLGGLEHLVGIPGSIGGAIYMNAGVKGHWISDVVEWVEFLSADGIVQRYSKGECVFAYRHSIFHKLDGVIVRAKLRMQHDPLAYDTLKGALAKRLSTQPIEEKNSGCIFKNPEGEFSAGALIERCGLKGRRIGGAKISTKHANFINNEKGATYADIAALVALTQKIVQEKEGVELECEVRIL
ncbi:UDP-N-acetylmuramate dehydrogenase [bacterium]|nr:UDP-N-acetylmuramate dehydrogenase [bacterium]